MPPKKSQITTGGRSSKKKISVLRETVIAQKGLKHSDQHSKSTTAAYKRTRKVFFQWLAKTKDSLGEKNEFTTEDINAFYKDQFDNENKKNNGDLYTITHYGVLKSGLRDLCAEHGMLEAYKSECKPFADRLMKLYRGLYKEQRVNALDDLNGIQRESITLEEFHEGAATGYNRLFNCKTQRLKLKNLRSLCDYLFGTYTMMRSFNRRGAMFSHFCLEELTHCPPAYRSKAKVLCIMKNVEKSLTDRDIKVSRIIRASDITYCPVFSLSLYWYYRYDIMKQELPDFSQKREWYNKMPVFSTLTNSSNILSAGAFFTFCKDYADDILSRRLDNPTHYMRKTGAKLAGEYFVPLSEICKQGGWDINEEIVQQFYMDCQPSTYLFRTHGHSISIENVTARLKMSRAILNYESVTFRKAERMIFPWIEEIMEPILNKQREEDSTHEKMVKIQIKNKKDSRKNHNSMKEIPVVNLETDSEPESVTPVVEQQQLQEEENVVTTTTTTTPDVEGIEVDSADPDPVAITLEDEVEEHLDATERWTRSFDKRLENVVMCLKYMRQVFVEDLVELSFKFPEKISEVIHSKILNSPHFQLLVKAAGSFKKDPDRFFSMADKEYEENLSPENNEAEDADLSLLSLLDKFVIRELWVDIQQKRTCSADDMRKIQNQLVEANKRNVHLGVTMGVSVSLSERFTRECEQMETYRKDALGMFDRIGEMDENLHEMSNDISDLKSIANSLLLQNNKIEKLLESNTARND